MNADAVAEYLRIPGDYEGNRYSLSWAAGGDAIERPDGSTFAFATQLALFLEGYASVGPLIHVAYILYLLQRFDARLLEPDEPGLPTTGPGRELVEKSDLLASAFRKAGRPFRNAGALCARLCLDIPPALDAPDPLEVCRRLSNAALAADLAVRRAATPSPAAVRGTPPLSALDFEMRFLNALKALDAEEIASRLEEGRAPLPDPGPRLAEAIVALKPRTLEGALASLTARERLSGAVPMVAQLVGALTLPPRRLAHQALPTGGYADVATRGRPEQILPSQFAIDDVEFLRRFAENELLYFHREEPHAPLTEELVLLLDQGVRTWGRVRHALNASALALGRLAGRRKIRLLVASTGSPGRLFDPLRADDEALGALWEASDLSPNPSLALEHLLEDSADLRRDVVVLSHPRNVVEADFAAATRRAGAGTRVFSVAIDEPGHVQYREWRRGVPVKVGDFRVDFAPAAGPAAKGPDARGHDSRGWRGTSSRSRSRSGSVWPTGSSAPCSTSTTPRVGCWSAPTAASSMPGSSTARPPRFCPGGSSTARSSSRSTRSSAWPTASWSAGGSARPWWRSTTTWARRRPGPTTWARPSTTPGIGPTPGTRTSSSPDGGRAAGPSTSRSARSTTSSPAMTRRRHGRSSPSRQRTTIRWPRPGCRCWSRAPWRRIGAATSGSIAGPARSASSGSTRRGSRSRRWPTAALR